MCLKVRLAERDGRRRPVVGVRPEALLVERMQRRRVALDVDRAQGDAGRRCGAPLGLVEPAHEAVVAALERVPRPDQQLASAIVTGRDPLRVTLAAALAVTLLGPLAKSRPDAQPQLVGGHEDHRP